MDEPSYRGKKVVILGLGRYEHGSGIAAVKFFIKQNANLVITDLQSEEDLSDQIKVVKDFALVNQYQGDITWVMGEHREDDILSADLIIPNPGVPITSKYVKLALENNIPVQSEMSIFFNACPAKIIGVTGTRGKSTTAALISHLLSAYKRKAWLGGNIGKSSPLSFLDQIKKDDLVVLELSNFMLEYLDLLKISPQIAVLLNVLPDHLNRYGGDMNTYASVKEAITKHQSEEDILIVNSDNDFTNRIGNDAESKVVWFSTAKKISEGYYLDGTKLILSSADRAEEILDVAAIPLRGEHNYNNILAAVACVNQLEDDLKLLKKQIGSFASLEGRLQFIDEVNEITFINDTTSTTPVAAVAALSSLKSRPIILIAGGADKDLPLDALAASIKENPKAIIWLPGNGTDRIREIIDKDLIDQVESSSMQEAVKQAFVRAEKGDVILLSPGFASFGLFKNEFDRGDQFNDAVVELKQSLRNHV